MNFPTHVPVPGFGRAGRRGAAGPPLPRRDRPRRLPLPAALAAGGRASRAVQPPQGFGSGPRLSPACASGRDRPGWAEVAAERFWLVLCGSPAAAIPDWPGARQARPKRLASRYLASCFTAIRAVWSIRCMKICRSAKYSSRLISGRRRWAVLKESFFLWAANHLPRIRTLEPRRYLLLRLAGMDIQGPMPHLGAPHHPADRWGESHQDRCRIIHQHRGPLRWRPGRHLDRSQRPGGPARLV